MKDNSSPNPIDSVEQRVLQREHGQPSKTVHFNFIILKKLTVYISTTLCQQSWIAMIRKTERALVQGSHKEGSGPERVPYQQNPAKANRNHHAASRFQRLPDSWQKLLDGGFTQPAPPGLLKSRHCAHVARQSNVCRISTTHGNAS